MPSSLTCPDDAELLAVVAGDEPSAALRGHLADCSSCLERLGRFKAEVGLLRRQAPEAVPAASTASGPACDSTAANGRAGEPDATAPRPAAESSEMRTSEPETDLGVSCGPGATGEANVPAAIGKYLVVGRFPRTGQAEVFRMVHPGLARELVLKLSLTSIPPDGRCDVIEEGKILAALKHPNLVQVYDQDFHDDRPYLVMEYIRGRTLEQMASEGGLTTRSAVALLAKVAGAVDYAHQHGIVHRDIKPKNILVDEAGEPRLIDFGMARLRHAWSDDPGSPGGTFAFMAPEQARVESPEEQEKVGPRSDVFALGAVLYYLLTGGAPFAGKSWRESMDRARRCEFDRSALENAKVARGLRRICLKAMDADPAGRYPSAEALARSLRAFLRRPRQIAGLAAVLLIPAAAWGAWSLWPAPAPSGPRTVVIQQAPVYPAVLQGEMTLRVWSPGKEGKRGWKIGVDTPEALPVRRGEMIQIDAKLNQPAYVYFLWLDGQGTVTPLYPWLERDLKKLPSRLEPFSELKEPAQVDQGWPLEGPSGLETVLMLARRTPLPREADLAAVVGQLPPSPLRNPLEVAVRGFDMDQPVEAVDRGQNRGPASEAKQIDDPLLQLLEKLRVHFELTRAVRFAYKGD